MRVVDLEASTLRRLVEVDAARTAAAATRKAFVAGVGLTFETRAFGGALAMRDASHVPFGFVNRVVGFSGADVAELDALVAYYAEVGAACQINLSPDTMTVELMEALRVRGFEWAGGLAVFRGAPERVALGEGPIRVEQVVDAASVERALAVRDAVDPGIFASPERRARFREHVLVHDAHRVYCATLEGEPAAVAELLFTGDACHIANVQTAPALRRRGCQRALLERCLDAAARAGSHLAVTDTFFANTSHRNMERAGFRLAYVTTWMSRAPDP